jgi:hypothetical protein
MVSIVNDLSADTGNAVVVRRVGSDDGIVLAKKRIQLMDSLPECWKITRVQR